MSSPAASSRDHVLNLRSGDRVEVRSAQEILETLDDDGHHEGLAFMPEMLAYCGRRFRVSSVAHKTCDTIHKTGCRNMPHAVHLEDLRCDGASHGGCQAHCLLFFKEAWLKRVGPDVPLAAPRPTAGAIREHLEQKTKRRDDPEAWTCQTTRLFEATSALAWWDPRQYFRDLTSGNVGVVHFAKVVGRAAFNWMQRRRGGRVFPYVSGSLVGKTPSERMGFQVGELVQVKSKEEIEQTLDAYNKNRGLLFDPEMLPFCGGTFRVAERVQKIIHEKTGHMVKFPNECIRLDGVYCKAHYSRNRLFCPRAIPPYWREIWLRRLEP